MLHASLQRWPDQVPHLIVVAFGATRQVHDCADLGNRRRDTRARGQVAGYELRAVHG
jgi:hypothetical protein